MFVIKDLELELIKKFNLIEEMDKRFGYFIEDEI